MQMSKYIMPDNLTHRTRKDRRACEAIVESQIFLTIHRQSETTDKVRCICMDWFRIRYFKFEEFDDPCHLGSHKFLDPITIIRLDVLRHQNGWPTVTHNKNGMCGCVCIS